MVQVDERVPAGVTDPDPAPGGAGSSRGRDLSSATVVALGAWAALVVVAHVWGRELIDSGQRLQLGPGRGAPPLVGAFDLRLGLRSVPGLVVAAAAVGWGPAVAARLGWLRLLVVAALGAAAFAVALAVIDPAGLTGPLLGRGEYLRDVGRVGSPLDFLAHFAERLSTYHTHTQGHPPGMVLLLVALDRAGLGGAGWAAALVIAGGAAAVPATLVAVRALSGEGGARVAAPFLVLAPAAIWVASSADAFYLGVTAAGIALLAAAGSSARRGRGDALAVGAGLVLGGACFVSYGAVLAAPIAAGVALAQRRWRPLLVAATASLAVAAVVAAAGFWWLDGLAATRQAYFAGVASRRPYGYFLVADVAAFALAVGPAAAVGLIRIRPPSASRATWLVFGALLAVVLADVSGLSKGEVERIWLPFVPWVLAATATLGPRRGWLGLQAGAALALAAVVRTPW